MTAATSAIEDALKNRKSIYAFNPETELSDSTLEALIEAGRFASSYRNTQPWAFIVVRRGTPEAAAFLETVVPGNDTWVARAGAVIVTVQHRIHESYGPDAPDYAAYDLGQAVGAIAIAAESAGLHTHQFAGFDHAAARVALGVPDGWVVVTGIAVGTPVTDPSDGDPITTKLVEKDAAKTKDRKDASEIVFWGTFGTTVR